MKRRKGRKFLLGDSLGLSWSCSCGQPWLSLEREQGNKYKKKNTKNITGMPTTGVQALRAASKQVVNHDSCESDETSNIDYLLTSMLASSC